MNGCIKTAPVDSGCKSPYMFKVLYILLVTMHTICLIKRTLHNLAMHKNLIYYMTQKLIFKWKQAGSHSNICYSIKIIRCGMIAKKLSTKVPRLPSMRKTHTV